MKNVLFPTDGSPAAQVAAEQAAGLLAGVDSARVTVLVAIALVDESETDFAADLVRQRNEAVRKRADVTAKRIAKVFEDSGIPVETLVLDGDPVSAVIAEEVKRGGYNLVAMGSRGLSLQKDRTTYLGSVAQHVLRRVSVPVLIFPINEAD